MSYNEGSYLTSSAIEATGSAEEPRRYRTIAYPFDQYVVYVKVDEEDQFVGITEIRINKQFLSSRQKLASMSSLDVEEFYKD
ncbi:MAG: hypothetical protein E4H14_08420 [Candidatus Thorarchaeota archaeon]|nr:MAG: hypothetical protein E4H14_08420 [Candidatus Thorarchaeota archaeon]